MAESSETQSTKKTGWSMTRIAAVATGFLVGLLVLLFVFALILAIADVERAGQIIQLVRDYLIIVILLEGILILFAIAVLMVQIARSVNLVQNEVKPILETTQETLNTVKGSAEFMSKNAAEPMIRASSFFSGLWVFLRELGGLRRAVRRTKKEGSSRGQNQ